MKKRKVQVVLFYCAEDKTKYFLLLKMNEKRGLFWQNVTGGVEENESFEDGAFREVKEETQLADNNIFKLHTTDFEFEFDDQWDHHVHEKVFLLQCKDRWDVKIDPSEHSEYKWISQDEINRESVHFETNYQALTLALDLAC